jgi:hypothetical protein
MALIDKREKTTVEDDMDNEALGATPYKGQAQRQDMLDDIKANRAAQSGNTEDNQDDEDDGDVDWKERYANLRKWSNGKVNTLVSENKELGTKVTEYEQRTGQDISNNLPGNDEDFAAFAAKHPALVTMIDRVAAQRDLESSKATNKKFEDLDKRNRKLDARETHMTIKETHPDWMKLQTDDVFLDWTVNRRILRTRSTRIPMTHSLQ